MSAVEQQDENRVDRHTIDERNPEYEKTGLQSQVTQSDKEVSQCSRRTASESKGQYLRPDSPAKSESRSRSSSPCTKDCCKNGRRQVTDPVTHLPLTLHDNTSTELERIAPPPATPQAETEEEDLRIADGQQRHDDLQALVDEETKNAWVDDEGSQRESAYMNAIISAGTTTFGTWMGMLWAFEVAKKSGVHFGWIDMFVGMAGCGVLGLAVAGAVYMVMAPQSRHEATDSTSSEDPKKKSVPQKAPKRSRHHKPSESAAWFNSFLSSLWPIVNPTLFVSVADMLEDVMQASLPKFIKGVRVADMGQGSESLRILGIRWLEAGDAHLSRDGHASEEGDFVNLELACAYRARPVKSTGATGLKRRSRNAHLLIEFWTAGGLRLPVWLEVTGILATARLRIQLTPNPPFLSEMIMTLVGQPKVAIQATPIAKNFLNVMDLPFVSNWLQSAIDEAVGQYVAPRSLTLNMKSLLMGSEKLDTEAFGIVMVRVIKAQGFKDGDGGKGWMLSSKRQRGDPYVTVGWGKWGKALWSTRILENEGEPFWDESNAMLVGPVELNAQERLRLQLWDSDRSTADDLLGTVEIPIQDIINSSDTKNRISAREDRLCDSEGEPWPGTISWEVGYFAKTQLEDHIAKRSELDDAKHRIEEAAEEKLREAKGRDETGEVEQQKKEDLKEKTDEIITSKRPSDDWPSGILSVQIQQITGLEVDHIRQSGVKDEAEDEEGDDLPSPYCTIILNHQKVFKTRTKLKSNKPFFDAGTERFVRDWQTATVMISVRDSREHESDPLLGLVVLPLHALFAKRSQTNESYPLVGGIGHGRIRLKLLFRSVRATFPPPMLGWDIGTLEIKPIPPASDLPEDLKTCRLVFRLPHKKGKMHPTEGEQGGWDRKRSNHPLRLAITKRYQVALAVHFRHHALGPDKTPAHAVLWLRDIPDSEDTTVTLTVYRSPGSDALTRAMHNAAEPLGQPVGHIEITVRFHPGLSGYHQALADANMGDVMSVLDAAEDCKETADSFSDDGRSFSSSSSDSDSDSYSDRSKDKINGGGDTKKCGIKEELHDYRKNHHDMHRRHRGLMQWRGVRNLAWIKDEVKDKGKRAKERVWRHRSETGGIETEV